jgi:peptide/nickel transport system substrate-binding protein
MISIQQLARLLPTSLVSTARVGAALLLLGGLTAVLACNSSAPPPPEIPPADTAISDNAAPQQSDEEKRVLTVAMTFLDEPPDPFKAGWLAVPTGLSETLFRMDQDLKPEPWLASGATQVGPTTWEVSLRQGIKFHNGAVMDAAKVKGSLDLALARRPGTQTLLDLKSVTVKDPSTVVLETNSPNPTLSGLLTNQNTAIADPDTIPASLEESASGVATTGPYVLDSFAADQSMTVTAHSEYWGGGPALDRVEYVAFSEANSRLIALQSGDVDLAVNLSPQGAESVAADPELEVKRAPPSSMLFLFVNHQRPAMNDLRVRQAISLSLDRATLAKSVAQGNAIAAESMFPAGFLNCPDLTPYSHDVQAAKGFLAEAGYHDTDGDGVVERDGQPLELTLQAYPQQPLLPPMIEAVQAMLREVGISSEIQIVEFHFASQGGYDLFGYSNSTVNTGDPQWALTRQYLTGGDENRGNYSNAEVDELIGELSEISGTAAREEAACAALQAGHDDIALIPVMHPNRLYGVSQKVHWPDGPHAVQLYFMDHRIGLR